MHEIRRGDCWFLRSLRSVIAGNGVVYVLDVCWIRHVYLNPVGIMLRFAVSQ